MKFETARGIHALAVVRHAGHPGRTRQWIGIVGNTDRLLIGIDRQRVDEDVVILVGFIVHIVAAEREIERPLEFGGDPEFLAELPGPRFGQIGRHQSIAATQLGIAKDAICICERAACSKIGLEQARRGGKAIVILGRPEEIVIEAGLRNESQCGGELVFRVELNHIVLDLVGGIYLRFDHAQILRLRGVEIGADIVHQPLIGRPREIGQRVSVRHFKSFGRIERDRLTPLREINSELSAYRATAWRIGVEAGGDAAHRCRQWRVLAKLFGAAQPIVILREVLPDEVGLQMFQRAPSQSEAARPQIAAVDILLCDVVERIAVALCPFACEAQIKPIIDDGDIDHAFETLLTVIAEFGRGHGLKLIAWLDACQVHHACRGIAAIERALRPAQHFDLSRVVEFLLKEVIADEGCVVEGNGDGGIGGHRNGLCADAADLDAIAGEIGFGEVHVGNGFDEIRSAGGLGGGQLFLA